MHYNEHLPKILLFLLVYILILKIHQRVEKRHYWQTGDVAGIKLVTVAPDNHQHQLPSIQGTYLPFDVKTGTLKASMDAPSLTAKRTAAASALASRFLSREDSKTLLIIGTGTLSSQLIEAHASVRPIKIVYMPIYLTQVV
ncbi:MAG: ornithine cyclodeaminase/alanine dehydrogenase-like protein (mu-crystallin family) [Colwellia sp.]|jgi:ornithine cyclodeaminase/alanine dehydrogenase-like protein (mu-crystallin family)